MLFFLFSSFKTWESSVGKKELDKYKQPIIGRQ